MLSDSPSSNLPIFPASLSTMWAIGHCERLADFVHRARELGFTAVELNYQIPPSMMEEALAGLETPVSSLHSPTPVRRLPNGRLSHDLSLTSLDQEERETAVRLAEETLDYACRLGAQGVVVHLGGVPLRDGLETRLREMYNRGLKGTDEYEEAKERLLAQRTAEREPYLEAGRTSLRRLAARAAQVGVPVGLEVRYFIHEIPNLEEMVQYVEAYSDGSVGYWHDVGHAENQARLGIVPHEEWLQRLGPRIVGVHLHDLQGLSDHRAAGKGDLGFAMVARYLPPSALRVCEFAPFNSDDEVRAGRKLLAQRGILAPDQDEIRET